MSQGRREEGDPARLSAEKKVTGQKKGTCVPTVPHVERAVPIGHASYGLLGRKPPPVRKRYLEAEGQPYQAAPRTVRSIRVHHNQPLEPLLEFRTDINTWH